MASSCMPAPGMRRRRLIGLEASLLLGSFFALGGVSRAHTGIVDGYGCHRGSDKTAYHCHQGQFAGRTFKSKEDFLRQLRGGKAAQLSPQNNPPRPEKTPED